MRIINIIARFDKVNFVIWNAAIATAKMQIIVHLFPH